MQLLIDFGVLDSCLLPNDLLAVSKAAERILHCIANIRWEPCYIQLNSQFSFQGVLFEQTWYWIWLHRDFKFDLHGSGWPSVRVILETVNWPQKYCVRINTIREVLFHDFNAFWCKLVPGGLPVVVEGMK